MERNQDSLHNRGHCSEHRLPLPVYLLFHNRTGSEGQGFLIPASPLVKAGIGRTFTRSQTLQVTAWDFHRFPGNRMKLREGRSCQPSLCSVQWTLMMRIKAGQRLGSLLTAGKEGGTHLQRLGGGRRAPPRSPPPTSRFQTSPLSGLCF